MRNGLACILVVWAFVANPALCVAGLWVRECPEPCTCCDDGCDPCTHHGCEDDPCHSLVAQVQKSRPGDLRPDALGLFALTATDDQPAELISTSADYARHAGIDSFPGVIALRARLLPLLI